MNAHWPADRVERWPIERLIPYARNARTHSEAQVDQIAASIREWGWTNPVLVDEGRHDYRGPWPGAGGTQARASAEVPVMVATGWTEAQKQAYAIADNKLDAERRLGRGSCSASNSARSAGAGLRPRSDRLLRDRDSRHWTAQCTEGLTDPDDVPDLPAEPVSAAGRSLAFSAATGCCAATARTPTTSRRCWAVFIRT